MPHKVVDWHAGAAAAVADSHAVARDILNGTVAPAEGCSVIAALCTVNDWPRELLPLAALSHEQEGHEHLGLNRENTAPLILDACRTLLGGADET